MYPSPQGPGAGSFVQEQILSLTKIGLPVEVMFEERERKGMGVYWSLKSRVREKVKNCNPDLIHVMYGGVMANQVTGSVHERPTVVTFHGSDLLGQPFCGFLRKTIAAYGVWASWQAARRASGIVVVSKILRDALPDDVNRAKIRVIPCGVDLELFKPLNRNLCRKRLNWDLDRFHVLFPAHNGNLVKRPGLARAALKALKRLGVHAELHELQNVNHTEVPVWLNSANVLLMTSWHEGSPTIVKEALACNLPVVSVDVGDVHERIWGIEGCYLASAQPEDLAAKLRLVHAGPDRVAGHTKIQEVSLERTAARLKELYDEVVTSQQTSFSKC